MAKHSYVEQMKMQTSRTGCGYKMTWEQMMFLSNPHDSTRNQTSLQRCVGLTPDNADDGKEFKIGLVWMGEVLFSIEP
jgi:hypothetical protein